jgi:hypothetical protein
VVEYFMKNSPVPEGAVRSGVRRYSIDPRAGDSLQDRHDPDPATARSGEDGAWRQPSTIGRFMTWFWAGKSSCRC